MIVLPLTLYTDEPVLATRLEGDPNSSVSYPYLPGGLIRGALASRFANGSNDDLLDNPEARRLFFDGTTRYLNGYLLDRNDRRTLPVPWSWFRAKNQELENNAPFYDFSLGRIEEVEQPKALAKDCFCRLSRDRAEFFNPDWQINIHTQRERVAGRAMDSAGAVFRYQALAAGQGFGAAIIAQKNDVKQLRKLLGDTLWLGGSRSGGYGRVLVEVGDEISLEDAREIHHWKSREIQTGDKVVLTLLSDAILRDNLGGYTTDLEVEGLKLLRTFKQTLLVGGFNRKWGLPLPQMPAIQAGSVFVYEATGDLAQDTLTKLERDGIGMRRAEGFGRVAVNWHGEPDTLRVLKPDTRPTPAEVTLTGDSERLAGEMVTRLLRRDLDRALAERAQSFKFARPPSRAQVARLRGEVLNALPKQDVETVRGFLAALKLRGRQQYERARINGTPLWDWLNKRLDTKVLAKAKRRDGIWWLLKIDTDKLPVIAKTKAKLGEKLVHTYTLRLIERVLYRMSKEQDND